MKNIPAEQLDAATARMIEALEHGSFAPAFKENMGPIHKSVGANFATTAAPHGGPWPPRKKTTDGHPLLIESGKLFQSATSDFGAGQIGYIGEREAFTGVDPNEVPYAATQNFGRNEANIPAREFEDVDDAVIDAMLEVVADRGVELLL